MATVKELISEISSNLSQSSSNSIDEVRVAQAMLNDQSYVVDVYGKSGVESTYSPYTDSREMISDIIRDTTKMSETEANEAARKYQFTKSTAKTVVNLSKEYINTYLQTGRKLPLGAREKSNVGLLKQVKEAKTITYPAPTGVDAGGNKTYSIATTTTPEYETIKVVGKCPSYIKDKK